MNLIFFSSMNNKAFIVLLLFNIGLLLLAVFCFECFRAHQHCNLGLGCPCVLKILCCHILLKHLNTYSQIQTCQIPSKPVSHGIIKAVLLPHSSVPKKCDRGKKQQETRSSQYVASQGTVSKKTVQDRRRDSMLVLQPSRRGYE